MALFVLLLGSWASARPALPGQIVVCMGEPAHNPRLVRLDLRTGYVNKLILELVDLPRGVQGWQARAVRCHRPAA